MLPVFNIRITIKTTNHTNKLTEMYMREIAKQFFLMQIAVALKKNMNKLCSIFRISGIPFKRPTSKS